MYHATLLQPRVLTPLAQKVLQCRLSLKETQAEFAKRFRINNVSLCRWENGRVQNISNIHREILEALYERLHREGMLMPLAVLDTITRQIDENRRKNG